MQLIGQEVLTAAMRRHSDARRWIVAWTATVENATWQRLHDVRQDYPSADGVKLETGLVITVFNVRGNVYRLLTIVNFEDQVVRALELLTHAEYDKEQWKRRY